MLEPSHILAHAQQGLNEAKAADIFKARRSELRSTMPQRKSSGYNTLLHRLGVSNPWGNRCVVSRKDTACQILLQWPPGSRAFLP